MLTPDFLALALIVVLSHASQAMTGFGAIAITLTLGAHFYPVEQLVPVLVPMNFALSLYLAARYREHVDHRQLWTRIAPVSLAAVPVGLSIYFLAQSRTLRVLYATFIIAFAAAGLIRERPGAAPRRPERVRWFDYLWLLLGGVMEGIFAAGGPPIVMYARRAITDKSRFRSTLSLLWVVLVGVLVAGFAVGGAITPLTLKFSAMLIPSLIAGTVLGDRLHHQVNEDRFRLAIHVILFVAGLSLLLAD
ncbi:sulfite exporter TauE/SafE family protein [bacterium]|nr:sulfite exporter TauE/SafE family protein [bacterium]